MYTRSYTPEERAPIKLPEHYDGNAFSEPEAPPRVHASAETVMPREEVHTSESYESGIPRELPHDSPREEAVPSSADARETGAFGNLLNSPLLGRLLPSFKSLGGGVLPFKLGGEELIIIGVALFLLFSGSGDLECALILLFLLFIN